MRRFLFIAALIAVASPAAGQESPSAWATLARGDIDAIRRDVLTIHPGMRDPQNPDFSAKTEAAYKTAIDRAAHARSFLDWRASVGGFIQSFRDGHTFLRFNASPTRVRWPGFLIDAQGDGYVAAKVAPDLTDIAEGDPVTACDDTPIATLMAMRLDGREADWSKPAERRRQGWRLFIDYDVDAAAPPIRRCSVTHAGKQIEIALPWRIEATAALLERAAPLTRATATTRPIALHYLPDGAAQIAIGSFGDEGALGALAKAMQADQARLRAAPYIVIDLRGNGGGNSTWGATFGAILYGDKAVAALPEPALGKYFRASPEAVARLRALAAGFAADGPDMAPVARYWRTLADRVAATPAGDSALFADFVTPPARTRPARMPKPLLTHPVFLLTDAGCFSSCIVAANTLAQLGAVEVGEITGENEEYGEVTGPLFLPSGLGRYWLPVSIIRQRTGDLKGPPLGHAWPGAMDDDAGLYAWIAGLAKAR